MATSEAHAPDGADEPSSICTCVFCPNPPMADDYPMPVMCDDGTWVVKNTHRYCILVQCVGQETADLAWQERTRPYDR
jgi:hypothetical protein